MFMMWAILVMSLLRCDNENIESGYDELGYDELGYDEEIMMNDENLWWKHSTSMMMMSSTNVWICRRAEFQCTIRKFIHLENKKLQ